MVLITEPSSSLLTPQTTPEELKSIKFPKKDPQSNSETENSGKDRAKRNGKPSTDPLQVADTESDAPESRRKRPLKRLKDVDQTSLLQSPSDNEAKLEQKKAFSGQLSKMNDQFHKLFKEISGEELLKQSCTCALQKDMLYQGKLYVSENWICFHSKVFGRGIKITIPVLSVTQIKKTKTVILVPNALVIATADERHVFVSFLYRQTTYKLLKSVCPHLDGEKLGPASKPSSAESSFRSERPSSLQLDSSGDFSDLDRVLRKRRKDLMESSSSGSQSPDEEKTTEFPAHRQNYYKASKKGEVAVHADVHLQKSPDPKHGPHRNGHVKPADLNRGAQLQPASLNALLLLYLLLVCILVLSSCYMAFKIMSLEERLTTLAEYPHSENVLQYRGQPDVDNAEITGELSTSLLKLEKVQRNLRKLLQET